MMWHQTIKSSYSSSQKRKTRNVSASSHFTSCQFHIAPSHTTTCVNSSVFQMNEVSDKKNKSVRYMRVVDEIFTHTAAVFSCSKHHAQSTVVSRRMDVSDNPLSPMFVRKTIVRSRGAVRVFQVVTVSQNNSQTNRPLGKHSQILRRGTHPRL